MANWVRCSNGIWIDLDRATKIGNRKNKDTGKHCVVIEYFEKEYIVACFDNEEDAESEIKKIVK
jgi:hypothetical protein